jgi:aryl carrier-like protein
MTDAQVVPAAAAAVGWHAAQDPDRTAVVDADGARGYAWLAAATERVAATVAQRPDEHFGVPRRPTAAFVATLLGCLRAGATFSVLDPDCPVDAGYLGVTTVLPDAIDQSGPGPAGDGGAHPPGDDWAVTRFGLRADDRFAVLSGLSGQLVSAVSSAVCAGGTLLLGAPPAGKPDALVAWLRDTGVTVLVATTPMLRAVTGHAGLPAVRYAFVDNAGQLLPQDVAALRRVSPDARCVATYRVDRAGQPLAVHAVPDDWDPAGAPLRIPLGREPAGETAELLGASARPAAMGEVGEVCRGTYRTGDLARRWPDGTLEFVGLVGSDPDADPIETVAALRDLPDVRDAVVVEAIGADDEPVLVGYLAGPEPTMDATAVRGALAQLLPEHLVPRRLLVVPDLPLTEAGEYDLDALPDPEAGGDGGDDHVAPRTPLEHELTRILQELLRADRVGVRDSFFELGGFSLLATQLVTRIRESCGVELSLRDIFEAPTIEGLAQLILVRQVELSGAGELAALLDEIER